MAYGRLAAMSGVRMTEIQEYELPEPVEGQVLMRVSKANVCGSDIHMWEGNHIFRDHVMGHEMTGVVEALGDGVATDSAGSPISIGDRIVPVYYQTCQRCPNCLQGLFNICEHGSDFQGAPAAREPHFTGAFATHYVVQRAQYFFKVPDEVPDTVAAGANCGFAQMLYVLDQCGALADRTVVIQGAGGVGLFAAAIASVSGAEVIVVDGVADRLSDAERFGANHIVDMGEFPTVEDRRKRIVELAGREPDIVVEAAGVPVALDEAIRLVRAGGEVVEVGNVSVSEERAAAILPGLITRKCLTIRGTLRYQPWYLARALRLLAREGHRFPFSSLTDREYALEETQLALERAANKQVARAIIDPQRSAR
ncbi:zinc-binding dehydrogenase [Microbacterium sp. JB110]|uniref:zinc-binding dehydrogenase n=1 Tax=Microbacterium sp. JB110 TaxID=2024477 RepID=UPI00097ED233|nr:zinc-binding dehydrogenase [Microbacterium sp. JB110]RCS60784.1 zinc-binding alcohol dehydrogenase [Microbacterium sp. JB110]SJM43760.1 Alcohol dehydrogenase [Frigoribacterium sp. JB110]